MNASHPDPAVADLWDRAQCRDVLLRYARAVDQRDFAEVEACFTEDVTAPDWGCGDREELVRYIGGVAQFHTSMHFLGTRSTVLAADEAATASYALIAQRGDGEGGPVELDHSEGRYIERLRRTATGWQIYARTVELEVPLIASRSASSPDPAVVWLQDRAEIAEVIAQFAIALDELDEPRLRRVASPAIGALQELRVVPAGVRSRHLVVNQIVEVNGATASAWLRGLRTSSATDDQPRTTTLFASVLELERTDGRWLITGRKPAPRSVAVDPPIRRTSPDATVQALLDRVHLEDVTVADAVRRDHRGGTLEDEPGDDGPDVFTSRNRDAAVAAGRIPTPPGGVTLVGNHLVHVESETAWVDSYAYLLPAGYARDTSSAWSTTPRRIRDRFILDGDVWVLVERHVTTNRAAAG